MQGLKVSVGALIPAFDSSISAYTDSVPYATDSVELAPELPAALGATLSINGVPFPSGQSPAALPLAHGANILTVVVESKSGEHKAYTVLVVRDENPPLPDWPVNRRMYVNDQAAADSLAPALVRTGVKFVLQPGNAYRISLATDRRNDSLRLYAYEGGFQSLYRTLAPSATGLQEVFPLASDRSGAGFFVAKLAAPDSSTAAQGIGHVTLASDKAPGNDTLALRLLFIHQLRKLPDSTAKAAFAAALFEAMAGIFAPYGIVIAGSFDIVEPTLDPVTFPFQAGYTALPGARIANAAHLYLVDSISIVPGSGLAGTVLGFAPREVVDLDQDKESRVILSNPYNLGMSVSATATTAAHELGHFLGLRHTVSTRNDVLQDDDESNVEDGFTDTKFCDLIGASAKIASTGPRHETPGTGYCLRISAKVCDAQACDIQNLMYPVDCAPSKQTALSNEQAAFLKRNLALFRH